MLILRLVSRLPLSALYGITWVVYFLVFRVLRFRRTVAQENLANSFPDKSRPERARIEKAAYRHLADVLAEILKATTMSAEDLGQRVRLTNPDLLYKYLDTGKNVIVLTSHFCNWEWALLACTLHLKYPFHAVYKPMHIPFWNRFMLHLRSRFGGVLFPAKEILGNVREHRGILRIIGLVADQTPKKSDKKVWVDFLCQKTAFYRGPGTIARSTGYPVVSLNMTKLSRGHYEIRFEELVDTESRIGAPEIVSRYARSIEQQIRDHPQYWFWTHRRWKDRPEETVGTSAAESEQ